MSMKVKLSDQLRQEIEKADISQYELARRVGLDKSVLSRFMHGKSGLSVQNIDLIAEELELELKKKIQSKKSR
jgi:transcriptional regulator with XRE-family HTH domain